MPESACVWHWVMRFCLSSCCALQICSNSDFTASVERSRNCFLFQSASNSYFLIWNVVLLLFVCLFLNHWYNVLLIPNIKLFWQQKTVTYEFDVKRTVAKNLIIVLFSLSLSLLVRWLFSYMLSSFITYKYTFAPDYELANNSRSAFSKQ